MKFSMIKKILLYLRKCSFVWSVEKNKDILVLDGEGSEKLTPSFANYEYFILKNRDILYLRHILEAVFFKVNFNIRDILYSYHMRIISKVKPKLIITFIDNRPLFWEIDKNIHNKIPFITVQNGIHYVGSPDSVSSEYSHLFLNGKPFYSNLACISQYDVDYYSNNGVTIKKYNAIGSLHLSDYKYKDNLKCFDLCIVANSKNDRYANTKVWSLVLKYMKLHNVSVCIALKSDIDYQSKPLFDYFKNTNAIFVKRTRYSTHYLSDISKVTIGFASTALRQSFSRGNKIYPLNFASNLFDLPYRLVCENLNPSYGQFESHLNCLLLADIDEYRDKNKKLMKYLDAFEHSNTPEQKIRKIIADLIQS